MDAVSLASMDDLRAHVKAVLCSRDQLDPEQSPMLTDVLLRRNRPCGLFFRVQGPRRVRTYAVWAGEENRILFYDSQGVRFAETKLIDGPDPLALKPKR